MNEKWSTVATPLVGIPTKVFHVRSRPISAYVFRTCDHTHAGVATTITIIAVALVATVTSTTPLNQIDVETQQRTKISISRPKARKVRHGRWNRIRYGAKKCVFYIKSLHLSKLSSSPSDSFLQTGMPYLKWVVELQCHVVVLMVHTVDLAKDNAPKHHVVEYFISRSRTWACAIHGAVLATICSLWNSELSFWYSFFYCGACSNQNRI